MKTNKVQRLEALEQKRKEQATPPRTIDMFYAPSVKTDKEKERCVLEDYYK
ncbi:hypothetical protein [Klebsiella pneumoniae]